MDISVVLPVLNERDNLRELIPRLTALLERERLSYEIVAIDGGSIDGTRETAAALGARVVGERRRGYAGALETGFAEAMGDYVLTLDADLSHEPDFVARMWRARERGDIVIASRYVRGGVAYTSFTRRLTSAMLNAVLRRMLSMPVSDMSSGYRLYRREALRDLHLESRNFEVQEEILVRAYARGYSVVEVPFTYFPRGAGRSHAKLLSFGWQIMCSALQLWKLRNSLDSADYDERAYYSIIPLQRYWQHRRHRITVSWARGARRVLDAGCGSSLIVQSLSNAVGMDFSFAKLRFLRRRGMPLVQGSAFALPFKDDSFDCVISSQVIEHIPYKEDIFTEQKLLSSGLNYTIAYHPPFLDVLAFYIGPKAQQTGVRVPADERKFGAATRDDLAAAHAAILAGSGHENRTYSLTGDPAISFSDIAGILSKLTGTNVPFTKITEKEYLTAIGQGVPANIAQFVLEWVQNMGDGEWEEQTRDLETLIGRKATTPTEFFRDGYLPK